MGSLRSRSHVAVHVNEAILLVRNDVRQKIVRIFATQTSSSAFKNILADDV